MKKIFYIFLFFSLFISLSWSSEVLAVVNGENITKKDVNEFVINSIPGANYNGLNQEQKKAVVNQMVERKLFLEDAKRMNIEQAVEYQEALRKLKENLILDYWMKVKVEEIAILEKDVKQYYKNNHEKFVKPASVKVRHILVVTEHEAIDLISKLKRTPMLREKFIALAHEKSIGPSAVNGGELDWFVYEQMVPEFSEAAFSLKLGEITPKAVKTQFGYHIIYLEDKKEKGSIPYESAKEDIIKSLRMSRFKTKLDNLSKTLKKTAKIIVK